MRKIKMPFNRSGGRLFLSKKEQMEMKDSLHLQVGD